jgi:hypothetical protein
MNLRQLAYPISSPAYTVIRSLIVYWYLYRLYRYELYKNHRENQSNQGSEHSEDQIFSYLAAWARENIQDTGSAEILAKQKTVSRPKTKKNQGTPSIKKFEERDSIKSKGYLTEILHQTGYMDSMNLYQAFNQNPVNFVDPMGLQEKEFYAMYTANPEDLNRIQYFQNQARKGYAKGAVAAAATFVMAPLSTPTIIALCGSGLIYGGLEEYSDRRMAGQSVLEAKTGAIVDTLTLGTYPIFAGCDAGTGDTVSDGKILKIASDKICYGLGGAVGIVAGSLFSRLNPSTSQLMDDAFRVLDFQRTSTGYVAITSDIGLKPGDPLPDKLEIVVTGGSNKPGSFILKPRDKLPLGQVQTSGKSASIATDLTLETEIPKMFGRVPGKHDILSGAFVEDIRAAGFDVIYAPTPKNPFHVRIIPKVNTFNETGRSYLSIAFDKILKYKKSSK